MSDNITCITDEMKKHCLDQCTEKPNKKSWDRVETSDQFCG